MASPHRHPHEEIPFNGRVPEPHDVHDRRLGALAAGVASAHRTGADGLCPNLQCHGQQAPCGPARAAHHAAQLARRAPVPPVPPPPPAQPTARGRAAVPRGPSGLAGLFAEPEPTSPVDPASDATVFTPFRRPDAAYQNPKESP